VLTALNTSTRYRITPIVIKGEMVGRSLGPSVGEVELVLRVTRAMSMAMAGRRVAEDFDEL